MKTMGKAFPDRGAPIAISTIQLIFLPKKGILGGESAREYRKAHTKWEEAMERIQHTIIVVGWEYMYVQ